MTTSRHQSARQNHNIKTVDGARCFENVAKLEYFETTLTNKNLIN
jgi:hypothetical protein